MAKRTNGKESLRQGGRAEPDDREDEEDDRQDKEGEGDENRNQRQAQSEAQALFRILFPYRALAIPVHVSDYILGSSSRGVKGVGRPEQAIFRDQMA